MACSDWIQAMTISISILSDYTERTFSVVLTEGDRRRILNASSNSALLTLLEEIVGNDEREEAITQRWEEERQWRELCAENVASEPFF